MKIDLNKYKNGDIITVLKLDSLNRLSIGSIFDNENLYVEIKTRNHLIIDEDAPSSLYPIKNPVKTYKGPSCRLLNLNKFIFNDGNPYMTVILHSERSVKVRPSTVAEVYAYTRTITRTGNVGKYGLVMLSKSVRDFLASGNGEFAAQLVQNEHRGSYIVLKPILKNYKITSSDIKIYNAKKQYNLPVAFRKFNDIAPGDTLNIYFKGHFDDKVVIIEGKPGTCSCCGKSISRYETPINKKKECSSCHDGLEVLRPIIREKGLEKTIIELNKKIASINLSIMNM